MTSMKKIIYINIALIIFLISCGGSEAEIPTVNKINPIDSTFNYESLTNSGFKKSKSYKIDELPEANSAYYGWKEVGSEGRTDFEIRIYDTHQDAVEFGKFFDRG